jgi:hypothetical protein
MPTVINSHLLTCRKDIPAWLKACGYKRLAEIGVREGNHLKTWVAANPDLLLGVDLWADEGVLSRNDKSFNQERLDKMFSDLLAWGTRHSFNMALLRGDSVKLAEAVKDGDLDFVYIDADHTYEAVKADIAAWWPKVRVGGTLSGHDYVKRTLPNGVSFGVIQAVNEFAASLGITEPVWNTAGAPDQGKDFYASWFITKTKDMP